MTIKKVHLKPVEESGNIEKVIYELKLYVTGASPNSVKAITNIKNICDKYLEGKYKLEIIDVYQEVDLAEKEQLVALPMLIKLLPMPTRKLIGDLSDTNKVLQGIGIH